VQCSDYYLTQIFFFNGFLFLCHPDSVIHFPNGISVLPKKKCCKKKTFFLALYTLTLCCYCCFELFWIKYNVNISDNTAIQGGGGLYIYGRSDLNTPSNVNITKSIITNNKLTTTSASNHYGGAALYLYYYTNIVIRERH